MTPALRNRWSMEAARQLQGRTIKAAQYVPDEEFGSLLAIELDNGTVAFVMADDEGNGPGALHLQRGDDVTILPQVR